MDFLNMTNETKGMLENQKDSFTSPCMKMLERILLNQIVIMEELKSTKDKVEAEKWRGTHTGLR